MLPPELCQSEGERIAKLEVILPSLNQKLTKQGLQIDKIAEAINAIQLTLAADSGARGALKYIGHAAAVALGGICGALGGILTASEHTAATRAISEAAKNLK